MIKFFRKIRFDLIEKNKTGKYLKYAIGEIILVVIGILIALSINNWNEKRQKTKVLDNIYRVIADDLRKDSSEVATVLNFMKDRKNIFENILNDSLAHMDIHENKIISSILTDIRILNIDRRGYNLLRNFENEAVDKNDSLSFQISNFYANSIFFTEKVEAMILEDLIKVNDRWKNKDWYSDIMTNNIKDNYIEYMTSNQEFKNLCAFRYTLYYENYEPTIEQFQQGSYRILKSLNIRLKTEK